MAAGTLDTRKGWLLDWSRGVLRACGCVAVFLLTIEVCARVEDRVVYDAPLLGGYNAGLLRGSEDGIPCNVPNARFEKWRNNNLGFRGPDLSLEKPPGVRRIVCLGASETYGLYESDGNEWPAQLQRMLTGKNIQVVNASVVGLSLRRYQTYLTKHVLPLKPDLLVVSVNPYFFAVSQDNAARRNPPKPAPTAARKARPLFAVGQLRVVPKLKRVAKETAAQYLPGILKRFQTKTLQGEIHSLERTRLKGGGPRDTVPARYVENFRAQLGDFIRFAESQGTKVVLMTYPSLLSARNFSQYPEIFLDNRRFFVEYSITGMVDIQEKLNEEIRTLAAKNGVALVDMSARIPKSTDYFGDNVHYTDRGARLVAEGVAQEVAGTRTCASAQAGGL